jgi:hypothetical protein
LPRTATMTGAFLKALKLARFSITKTVHSWSTWEYPQVCQLSQSVMPPSIHASDDVEGPMDWDRWKAVYHKVARSVRRVSMQEHRERSPHRRPGRSAPLAVIAWATMYPLRVGTGGGGASSSRRIPRSTPASSSSETQRHHPLAHAPICRCSRSLAMIGAHPRRYLQRGGNS